MNRSRQEFSSRSKSFNSNNSGGGKKPGWKGKNREQSWDKKKSGSFPGYGPASGGGGNIPKGFLQKEKSKVAEKMSNGFGVEKSLPEPKEQKSFGKKVPLEVNGSGAAYKKNLKNIEIKMEKSPQSGKKADQKHSKQLKKQPNQNSTPEADKKRKIQDYTGASKKLKKEKPAKSDSDSDADDYMDKFFQDVSSSEEKESEVPEFYATPAGSSEEDSNFEASESDCEDYEDLDSEEDGGNAMSLTELLEHYGNGRDRKQKPVGLKNKSKSTANIVTKPSQSKSKQNTPAGNGWIVEDNDVGLVYMDSDNEQEGSSMALVPVGVSGQLGTSEDDSDYSPDDDSIEEDEISSGEDDLLSFELEGNSDDSSDSEYSGSASDSEGGASEVDDHEFSSDYDSDEDDDELSDSEEEDSSYWNDSYDSDDDGDYVPLDDDDLFIGRGEAKIYEVDDNYVSFNSDIETAQIVELPSDDGRRPSESQTEDDEREDCPELVPIYDARGRLIDSHEKLERERRKKEKSAKKSTSKTVQAEKQNTVESKTLSKSSKPEEMAVDEKDALVAGRNLEELITSNGLKDSIKSSGKVTAPDEQEEVKLNDVRHSSWRFYDSLDMRMSLLVFKEPLYFSGHLTIQPLIGGLEVMGYRLKRGECRNVFAVRGYHSLNMSPCPDKLGYSEEVMAGVISRLEKHFQNLDMTELQQNFDSAKSVLVLLQADCSNRRIAVVDKYLPEEVLFPKVEFLKVGSFFTTEYLLNVEFYTKYVDKSTAFYQSDPEWDKIEVKNSSKVVVIGGKGAGKSTLCQYLINKNVGKFKKVVLIDLDIGQPIHHIPETISVTIVTKPLLGVASLEPIPPAKSWLFGSLDVVSSPIFYVQNVRQLVKYCQQHKTELANTPWIINTMGYVTGFGEEMMAAILRMLAPTDVVQLVSPNKSFAIPNFQNAITADFVNQYNFNILRSEVQEFAQRKASFRHHPLAVAYPQKGFTLNAPKRRSLSLLAHLANILNDSSCEWFNEVKPFCAPLSKLQVLITREDQSLAEEQLPSVLNATLVYLCRKTDSGLYESLGIGIVRGVDKNNNVYLLQSLPGEELAQVTVLAICSSSLPNAIFLRQSTRIQGSIPYVYNVD